MGNLLRQLGSKSKKLVLGLKVKTVKGEQQFQVNDALPNLQYALLHFFYGAEKKTMLETQRVILFRVQ